MLGFSGAPPFRTSLLWVYFIAFSAMLRAPPRSCNTGEGTEEADTPRSGCPPPLNTGPDVALLCGSELGSRNSNTQDHRGCTGGFPALLLLLRNGRSGSVTDDCGYGRSRGVVGTGCLDGIGSRGSLGAAGSTTTARRARRSCGLRHHGPFGGCLFGRRLRGCRRGCRFAGSGRFSSRCCRCLYVPRCSAAAA